MSFKMSDWAQAECSENFGITDEEYSNLIVPKMKEFLDLCTSMGLPCSIFVTQCTKNGHTTSQSGNNFTEVPIGNVDISQVFGNLFARHTDYGEFKKLCKDIETIMFVKAKSNGVK